MNNKKERLMNISNEEFCLNFFDGTNMPNNPNYINITMFKDTFYIEDEKGEKENYGDMYFIVKVIKMIEDNIENIEKMLLSNSPATKSSYNHNFYLKINNRTYRVDRNICDEEGKKLFDDFKSKLYDILDISKQHDTNPLIMHINNWRKTKNIESFKSMIESIRIYSFYCPMQEKDGSKKISVIKNSKDERLLVAFSNMVELRKWVKTDETDIEKIKFSNYCNILLSENNNLHGLVIDPFGVNLVLDKKIIKDIAQLKK